MKCIRSTTEFRIDADTAISLGKFDGLHTGHKLLLDCLLQQKLRGRKTVVFSFDVPPRQRLEQTKQLVLTTNEEKAAMLERMGVDYFIECPFTEEMMHMSAEDFLAMLVERFHVKYIVAGKDFRFGHNRRGDYKMLQSLSRVYAYEVVILEKKRWESREVSSTFIREEIMAGNMEAAEALLGYPYFIEGEVIYGRQLGRTIGVPTVNLQPQPEKLLPPFGVYVARVWIGEQMYYGVANVGRKPTVGEKNPIGVETHILDFHGNLYGNCIRVEFLHFVRAERRFPSVETLKRQLQNDIETARRYVQKSRIRSRAEMR